MMNLISAIKPLLVALIKLAGLSPHEIKLDQGTVISIWVPKQAQKSKPAVVFVHPFIANVILMWFALVLALMRTYNVYVPDLLFFGDSTTASEERSVGFQAACLAECLKILMVDKCTVVGLSYGGIVGFKMAELYPGLVENLVVSSAVIDLTPSISQYTFEKLGVDSWADILLPENVTNFKRMISIGTRKFRWLPDFVNKDLLEALFDNRKEKAELLKALVVDDKDSATPNYSQRIHFLWGADDVIFNLELAQTMKEKIGDKATLKWINDAGHLVQLERPFSYNRELKIILATFYPKSQ